MSADFSNLDPAMLHLHPADHFVEFYEDDNTLVDSVTRFISLGLSQDEAAIVIAEPSHLQAFEAKIGRRIDLRAARENGSYVALDAAETLSLFMRDGGPIKERFDRALQDVVDQMQGKKIRAFGEMVALLWSEGNVGAALALEDIWNDFLVRNSLRLFCAYPSSVFGGLNKASLEAVCDRHSHILIPPTEDA
jgi:hypothetical protein